VAPRGRRREKINTRGLAALLKPWGVRSRNGREHGTGDAGKGYYAEDMADAFSRYVRSTATGGESKQASPVADCVADDSDPSATAADLPQPPEVAEVSDVATECLDGASQPPDVSPLRCSDPACEARLDEIYPRLGWRHHDGCASSADGECTCTECVKARR
jgi:hypothetical protein